MGFSVEWDERYLEGAQYALWPWSEMVSYFNRYAKPFNADTKILEIGFGVGANVPFFRAIGVDYYGIEGSVTGVTRVCDAYPELRGRLIMGDFTQYDYKDTYDIVIDRSSMTTNDTASIRRGLRNLSASMKRGSKYIGIDWFSVEHSDSGVGDVIDEYTRANADSGQFVGLGKVHFSDKKHLVDLFSEAGFDLVRLEHKRHTIEIPDEGHVFAAWNLVAIKR